MVLYISHDLVYHDTNFRCPEAKIHNFSPYSFVGFVIQLPELLCETRANLALLIFFFHNVKFISNNNQTRETKIVEFLVWRLFFFDDFFVLRLSSPTNKSTTIMREREKKFIIQEWKKKTNFNIQHIDINIKVHQNKSCQIY